MSSIAIFWLPSLPLFFIHLVVSVAFAYAAWRILSPRIPALGQSITVPLTVGLLVTGYYVLNSSAAFFQNRALVEAASSAKSSPAGQPAQPKTMDQVKDEFLATVETIMANPSVLTAESKAALFRQFEVLFPRGAADREAYFNELSSVYECQKAFYEDSLKALKSKKYTQSPKRESCKKMSGKFFNRETLVPASVASNNDETIKALAAGKKIEQNGQDLKIDEAFLRQGLEDQDKKIEVLKVLLK